MLTYLFPALSALLCFVLAVQMTRTAASSGTSGVQSTGPRWLSASALVVASVAMGAAVSIPFFVFFAAVLSLIVLGSIIAFYPSGIPKLAWVALAGALAAGAAQPLGLKVLLLPKADKLPHVPGIKTTLLKTYGPGMWFEGIVAGADGTLYLAANKGENYAIGDKSQVEAQVIARKPDGAESVFFALPKGSTAGVMAFDADGTMYMAGTGGNTGIWKIDRNGKATLFAQLPSDAWPNGVTMGPDGNVYVADSRLAVIWRVNPKTGEVGRAYEGRELAARSLIALAPGANGLHFYGRSLFVTVSDRGTVLKFVLNQHGQLEAPSVYASGMPADDFDIDEAGNLYVTTHPYNTLVRVAPDGTRSILADATQGIVGATDASFGKTKSDRNVLYVVTDGGAFSSGDKNARGTLVAIDLSNAE